MKKLLIGMQFMILLLLFGRSNIFASDLKLQLRYDDIYEITQNNEYYNYEIEDVHSIGTIKSKQVVNGEVTSKDDTDVVVATDKKTLKATGIGTAVVTLTNPSNKMDKKVIMVDVKAAPLTYILVAGQSNAAGFGTQNIYRPQDSIVCAEDQIYSTTASVEPGDKNGIQNTKKLTGVLFSESCTIDNADKFVPGNLTSEKSIAGNKLEYKTDHMSENGYGKCGPDSGIAYEWNQLTGDKVWIINTAVGATGIQTWIPGSTYYKKTKAICSYANQTYDAEIEAGHYTRGKKLLFWLQGENDRGMDASDYTNYFLQMFDGMQNDIGIEKLGVIMVRSSGTDQHTNTNDLIMTGPRISQYYMGLSTEYKDIYVASNVNEQWVTDDGVSGYFNDTYDMGILDYPLRSGISVSIPTTVAEVHSDIHYSQIAHNENGITAAYGMYEAIYQSVAVESVDWVTKTGIAEKSNGTEGCPVISLDSEDNNFVMAKSVPSYTKGTVKVIGDSFTYDQSTGIIKVKKYGTGYLVFESSDGKEISRAKIDNTADMEDIAGKNYNGIYYYNGVYYYLKNSIVQKNLTSLVKDNDKWWYIENGQVNYSYDGLVYYNGSWWYVHNGMVDFNATQLVKYNGNWWYVKGGYVRFDETTVCKKDNIWWYVKAGMVDFSANTLVKYNGSWWYIKNGQIDFNATLLTEYNGTTYYVEKGIVNFSKNGIIEYGGNKWYIKSGVLCTGATTLVKNNGTWWYVKSGRVSEETTLVKYDNIWWYIRNGKIDFGARTLIKYNGNWFFISGGKVDFKTATLVKYNGNWFYVKNGVADFNATTLVKYSGNWFYVKNGVVDFKTTTLVKYSGSWFYVKNGVVDFNATTLVKYNGSWFYVKNGAVDFKTTTLIKYNGNWFYVSGGYVRFNENKVVNYNGVNYQVQNGIVVF